MINLQFAGSMDGDRPTHIHTSARGVLHAGLVVKWVRWQHIDGDDISYSDWEPVRDGLESFAPRPGRLG